MGLTEFSLDRFESKIFVDSPSWILKRQYNHLTAHIFIFSLFVFHHPWQCYNLRILLFQRLLQGECRQLYPTLVLLLIPSRYTASQSLQFRWQLDTNGVASSRSYRNCFGSDKKSVISFAKGNLCEAGNILGGAYLSQRSLRASRSPSGV